MTPMTSKRKDDVVVDHAGDQKINFIIFAEVEGRLTLPSCICALMH